MKHDPARATRVELADRALLGVGADADWATIKTARHARIRAFHPDINHGVSGDALVSINAAFDRLKALHEIGMLGFGLAGAKRAAPRHGEPMTPIQRRFMEEWLRLKQEREQNVARRRAMDSLSSMARRRTAKDAPSPAVGAGRSSSGFAWTRQRKSALLSTLTMAALAFSLAGATIIALGGF